MCKKSRSSQRSGLSAMLERCLPRLQAIALSLDIYGNETDAANLQEVIKEFKSAFPKGAISFAGSLDFVVNGMFKVTRQQVANTLWHAFTGEIPWFKVANTVAPRKCRFRSIDQTSPGIVDYPLNEGGMVRIVKTGAKPEIFELRLDMIGRGLDVLASYYPRHFVDLVNENADSVTGDALLQCCIFGELVYG